MPSPGSAQSRLCPAQPLLCSVLCAALPQPLPCSLRSTLQCPALTRPSSALHCPALPFCDARKRHAKPRLCQARALPSPCSALPSPSSALPSALPCPAPALPLHCPALPFCEPRRRHAQPWLRSVTALRCPASALLCPLRCPAPAFALSSALYPAVPCANRPSLCSALPCTGRRCPALPCQAQHLPCPTLCAALRCPVPFPAMCHGACKDTFEEAV